MKNFSISRRGQTLWALFVSFSIACLLVLYFPSSKAEAGSQEGLFPITRSHSERFPNYDIRTDNGAGEKLAAFRGSMSRSGEDVAAVRGRMARGANALRAKVPTAKIEYSANKLGPEVIAPDVAKGRAMLAGPSARRKSDVLKGFLKQNPDLVVTSDADVDDLKTEAEYTNPDGELSFAELSQDAADAPVRIVSSTDCQA